MTKYNMPHIDSLNIAGAAYDEDLSRLLIGIDNKINRAEWGTVYINNLPDSAFAVVLPGGKKDDEGKTVPRDLRKLPHHNAAGDVDLPHLRNALARLPQTDMPADAKAKAARHLDAHAKDENVGQDSWQSPLSVMADLEKRLREWELEQLLAFKAGKGEAPIIYRASGHVKVEPGQAMTFVASEESEDRYGDVIKAEGWQLEEYRKNPVFMFGHDATIPPIGVSKKVWVYAKQLLAAVDWDEGDPFAQFIKGKYERGVMRAVSVGFRAMEFTERSTKGATYPNQKGIEFTKQELLELSAVSVPAHPAALKKALAGAKFGIVNPEIVRIAEFPENDVPETKHHQQNVELLRGIATKLNQIADDIGGYAEPAKGMDEPDLDDGLSQEELEQITKAIGGLKGLAKKEA